MWKPCSIVLWAVASGCVPYASAADPDAGPRMLGNENAGAESRAGASTTANELTRVFAERGFVLEQHGDAPDGAISLELAKARRDRDTVYYAWIEPDGARGSRIWVSGGPMSYVGPESVDFLAQTQRLGVVADPVTQGAISELQLAGVVVGGLPPGAVPPAGFARVQGRARQDCEVMRREVAREAAASNDLDKRAEILATAPRCG